MNNKDTKMIVEAGISIALSVILSFIVIFRMPLGGSVTIASRLPIVIYAVRRGWEKGIIAAGVLGVVQMLVGGYMVHPIQVLLDYLLSYGAMGLAGISFGDKANKFSYVPSIILSYIVSGAFNVISGMIYFYDMATAQKAGFHSFLTYALAYNYSFLAADALILLVVFILSYNSLRVLFEKQDSKAKF